MKRKHKITFVIISIILLVIVLTPVVYVQANKIIYAHRVTQYLLEEKKYAKDEIEEVRGVWGIKLPPFYAVVKFKDEPDVEYLYFAHSSIFQFSYKITEEGLKKQLTEKQLKHFDPKNW